MATSCSSTLAANWNGYFGDVARTTICGKPSRRQQENLYGGLRALRAGIAKMRPGCTNQDAAQAIIQTAEKYNLENVSCRSSLVTASESAQTNRRTW